MRKTMRRDSHETEAQQLDSIIDIDSIIITNHARTRYRERWNSTGNIDTILHSALKEGVVETQNGSIIQHINGNKPACIEVYIPNENELGLTRFVLRQEGSKYILLTLYPMKEDHVPFSILSVICFNYYCEY